MSDDTGEELGGENVSINRAQAGQVGANAPSLEVDAKIKTKAGLWWPRAVLQSFFNADVDFYPRLNAQRYRFPINLKTGLREGLQHRRSPAAVSAWAKGWTQTDPDKMLIKSVKSEDIVARMGEAMKGWTGPIDTGYSSTCNAANEVLEEIVSQENLSEDDFKQIKAKAKAALEKAVSPVISLDDAIELAKASLEEVKAQTEYQDQKATRLLTVTTFLSALSGTLFFNFSSSYPLQMSAGLSSGWQIALLGAYAFFVLFVFAAIAGALVTFHATRTRFKYSKEATAKRQAGPTRSFLFFREIIGVSPEGWAASFVEVSEGKPMLRPWLKEDYLKNYVAESYLIAAKTADKLRYLAPAQSLLAWALRSLLLFVILVTLIQANVPKSEPIASEVLVGLRRPVSAEVLVNSVPLEPAETPRTSLERRPTLEARIRVLEEE